MNATAPAIWFPTVRTGTGTDVFTERLVAGLLQHGIRTLQTHAVIDLASRHSKAQKIKRLLKAGPYGEVQGFYGQDSG